MEQRTIQVTLPADLVEQLKESKLLENEQFWERLIRDEMAKVDQRERAFQRMEAIFQELDSDPRRFTPEEIQAEIEAYRAEKRANHENRG